MKLILCSIGKQHDSFMAQAIEDYSGRINKYFDSEWIIIPAPKNAASMSMDILKKAEAQLLFPHLQKDDFIVLLDEKGKQFDSVGVARLIQQRAIDRTKRLVFVIGGAFGVDVLVTQKANLVWSLSQLVFPHMLVRLILSEQIYRACTIINNEKYHHQ